MVIAAILAGGSGSRMGNAQTPKQFLLLGGKPVLVHTLERFLTHPEIDELLLLCPQAWLPQTQALLVRFVPEAARVKLLAGGETRNGTLENALRYIAENHPQQEDAVIVTHDAVRPFLNHRIISENIEAARKHGATDTIVPATDTIVRSEDGAFISAIPPRSSMYQGQTPQSFRIGKLRSVLEILTDEERESLTDACMIFSLKGEPVYLVPGDVRNFKITYPQDLELARVLLQQENNEE